MKKIIFLLMLAMAVTGTSVAQQTRGISANLQFGISHAPEATQFINKALPPELREFKDIYYGFGGDAYYRHNRQLIGLEAFLQTQKSISVQDKRAEVLMGAVHAKWGWVVWQGKRYWLYPSMGFGMDALSLKTTPANPLSEASWYHYLLYTPSFDLGFNGDFMAILCHEDKSSLGGRVYGFRLGFRFSPDRQSWQNTMREKGHSPTQYGHKLVYLKFTMGLCGIEKE